jgi:formamidopyrimidine-DNA glycosylase
MPELPDIEVYRERLTTLLAGHSITGVRVASPFLLRTVEPPVQALVGQQVLSLSRLGKRLVFGCSDDLFVVLHLMVAGRLQWRAPNAPIPGRIGLFALDFEHGTLTLTEAGTKKRASLYVVRGADAVAAHDPGGLEVMDCSLEAFRAALTSERHTLKRSLTDPRLFSGIGNAYSDEILHHAKLAPTAQSTSLSDAESERLWTSVRVVLAEWLERLRKDPGDLPEKVTAFRPEMAVHGRAGLPCPRCGAPVQKIQYADNETNYCAPCQTDGRLLADRGLSRLLKDDFPRSLDELEALRRAHKDDAPKPPSRRRR